MTNRIQATLAFLLALAFVGAPAALGASSGDYSSKRSSDDAGDASQYDSSGAYRNRKSTNRTTREIAPKKRSPKVITSKVAETERPTARRAPARKPAKASNAGDDEDRPAKTARARSNKSSRPTVRKASMQAPAAEEVYAPPTEMSPASNDVVVEGPMFDGQMEGGHPDFVDNGGYCDDCCDTCTACDTCGPCGGCGPCGYNRGPIYARGEYLIWWLSGERTPPLVTTSPDTTLRAQAGVLGQPGTSVLFGGDVLNGFARNGARVTMGWWLNPSSRIEGEWFGLGQVQSTFNGISSGSPILARPFFNLSTGASDANVIAYPGQLSGRLHVADASNFLGAGMQYMHNLTWGSTGCNSMYRVDAIYGFRYLGLYENLNANSLTTSIDPNGPVPVGTTLRATDVFKTSNNFYGAIVGVMSERRSGRWCLTTIGRMGFGGTAERVSINGNSTIAVPGGTTTTSSGGLLAMPTNIGVYHHNGFTVLPQVEIKLGFDITPSLRITAGYDAIYWSRVVHPGGQIDPFVNPTQASGQPLVGTPGPRFAIHETDMWIQGLSTGVEYRF